MRAATRRARPATSTWATSGPPWLAWLFARTTGRRFLLRFEDLDAGRVRPGVAQRQRADLEALGLTFDPPVLVQSERAAVYADALAALAGHTYECFCTRREIAEAAAAPHGVPGRYPGTCRDLTAADRAERRRSGRHPAVRLRGRRRRGRRSPTCCTVRCPAWSMTWCCSDPHPAAGAGSVLPARRGGGRRRLGGVDQVVRGDDLLTSAPTQARLATLLGLPVPTYAHVPLALTVDGRRLAKRDGAVTLADLAPLGWTPARVLGLLATSLGLAEKGEPVGPADLLARFDPARVPRDPWIVRPARLVLGTG